MILNFLKASQSLIPCSLFLLILISCDNKLKDEQRKDVKPPSGVISPAEAKILDETYTRTRVRVMDSIAGKADNRSSWWSIEDMRNYLDYAEEQAKIKGYTLNGIRIYQGAYPQNYKIKEDAGYSTVFLVPTGENINVQEGNFLFFPPSNPQDIAGVSPLNVGHKGNPPSASYSQ
ncbi:MAG: hypothetical protein V7767_09905 [Leeuwenhoekiella sp.]